MRKVWLLWLVLLTTGITAANAQGTAAGINQRMNKYLGKWYEIARLPDKSEKNCTLPIISDYQINHNNNQRLMMGRQCRLINGQQKTMTMVADFKQVYDQDILKVSTWSELLGSWIPFFAYDSYWLYQIDHEQVTVVARQDRRHLWILARSENINMDILEEAIMLAQKNGFDTKELIFNYPLIWQK